MSESAVEEKTCVKCDGLGKVLVLYDGKSPTPWWYAKNLPFTLHLKGRALLVPAGHVVMDCPGCATKEE